MTIEQIAKIIQANATNKFIFYHLDENTQNIILDLLTQVEANDFKELNPNGKFEFTSLPIPYANLTSKSNDKQAPTYTSNVIEKMQELLNKINNENENYEYPALLFRTKNCNEKYTNGKIMSNNLQKTSCNYDWDTIKQLFAAVEDKNKENFTVALFHTHPNLFGKKYGTLFEKYEEQFSKLGVKPSGLNISLADIYANLYLDNMLKEHGLPQIAESVILMHDGNVISFTTNDGIVLTGNDSLKNIEKQTQEKSFS